MFQNAIERFKREIESIVCDIAIFEQHDRSQRLNIVVETAIGLHGLVERPLPGMAKGRVAEIVRERDGLGQILIEAQSARDRTRNL